LVKKDFDESGLYEKGFKVDELFPVNNVGIVTARDSFTFKNSQEEIRNSIETFLKLGDDEARVSFDLGDDSRDWQVNFAKKDLQTHFPNVGSFIKMDYRPFDSKWTFYTGKTKGFHSYPRYDVMKHLLKPNVGLITPKQAIKGFQHVFISKTICDKNLIDTAGQFGAGNVFPLYLYPQKAAQAEMFGQLAFAAEPISEYGNVRTPNLNPAIIKQIADGLGINFEPEKTSKPNNENRTTKIEHQNSFAPIDVLDYIYAVLHSPNYREKYKEFLKIDFPRVPYPKDVSTFWQLVKLGGEIRQIHLLESDVVEEYITEYPESGDDVVEKIKYENERVYINETQYFDNVPSTAWNFYIGGYQPAQKWLKDRKGRILSYEDMNHYQKIIVALTETARLMGEIDLVGVE
jgi:predicted helicase